MEVEAQAKILIGNVFRNGMELSRLSPGFDEGVARGGSVASCRWGCDLYGRCALLCEEYEFGSFDLACVCFGGCCVALVAHVFLCC